MPDLSFKAYMYPLEQMVGRAMLEVANARPENPIGFFHALFGKLVVQEEKSTSSPLASAPSLKNEHIGSHVGGDRVSTAGSGWMAASWLQSLGIADVLADSLLLGLDGPDELSKLRSFSRFSESSLSAEVQRRLSASSGPMAERITPQLLSLISAEAVTNEELYSKFASSEGTFSLSYKDMDVFYGGLEGQIGTPKPNVWTAIEAEHTQHGDSRSKFITGNYSVRAHTFPHNQQGTQNRH